MATSKISFSSIKVKTNDYVNTHGKAPKGYGFWFFQIGEQKSHITGNYSEAVKCAKQLAQRQNISQIEVLG
jgi:hypothetical protein